jgi:hypothetical protein
MKPPHTLTLDEIRAEIRDLNDLVDRQLAIRERVRVKLLRQTDERPLTYCKRGRSEIERVGRLNEQDIQETIARRVELRLELEARTAPPPIFRTLSKEAQSAIAELPGKRGSSYTQRFLDDLAIQAAQVAA